MSAGPSISTALGSLVVTVTALHTLSAADSAGELSMSSRLRDLRAQWSDRPPTTNARLSSFTTDENVMLLGRTWGRFTLDLSSALVVSVNSAAVLQQLSSNCLAATPRRCSTAAKQDVKYSWSTAVTGNWGNSQRLPTPHNSSSASVMPDSSVTGLGWVKLSWARAVVGEWRDKVVEELFVMCWPVGDAGLSNSTVDDGRLTRVTAPLPRSRCSYSNNWPRKLKLGEIVGRFSLTYLQYSHSTQFTHSDNDAKSRL